MNIANQLVIKLLRGYQQVINIVINTFFTLKDTKKASDAAEPHPKSFVSNFWGALCIDTITLKNDLM